PVTPRVPIRRDARIRGMIQNRNRDRLIADLSAQIAPAAARTPGGFAFFAFAGQIDSVHAGVVELRHGSSSPARVGENFRFVRGHFQGTHDAQAEHPVLRISKDYLFVLCAQRTKRDRKSTRLNSSHLVISYAVFCLKKKTKK